jgi:hypothetical protein
MMNSAFVLEQTRVVAGRLLERTDLDTAGRVRHLYEVAYSREPSEAEVSRAAAYLERVREAMNTAGMPANEIELRSWSSLCRAVVSASEFLYAE